MRGTASLADIEAIEAQGFPPDLPTNTYALLERSASRHPDAPALSFMRSVAEWTEPQTWSYRQFLAQVTRTANALHALGAGKDDVIAVLLPNLPQTHFAVWGGQATGIAMPINYLLAPAAIVDLLLTTGASILVTAAPAADYDLWTALLPALTRASRLRHVLLVHPDSGTSEVATADADLTSAGAAFQVHDFARVLRQQPGDRLLSARRIAADDYSSFLCTGGTTGAPKVAMRRHRNEVSNAWSVAQCLGDGMALGKNVFCGLPLFHANGLLVTGLLPFLTGAHVLIGTPLGYRSPGLIERFWAIVETHRIHFFSAVPTIYGALLQVPRGDHRLDSLEYGLCGAAPMPRELLMRFQQETGLKILEGYGLTEGTCVSSLNPPLGERRIGSIGLRLPAQAMQAVVLDSAAAYQREARLGETGALVISGPNVFAGYRLAEQNTHIWIDIGDGRQWLHTGDLGYRDAQGFFWLTGRAKDLIIRGGHNIDPAAIEQPLYAHPAVQLAAAVGRPDAHAGELPVVYVQPRPGHAVTDTELQRHLEQHVHERAALPKAVVLIDHMPLTAIGKINKPELRRRQAQIALREALLAAGVQPLAIRVDLDPAGRGLNASVELSDPESQALAERIAARLALRFCLV